MPVPGYQEFMRPLLEVLSDGHQKNVREVYAAVADRLHLTEADRQELIPSATQRLLDNRVGWAKTYLLKAGLLESPRRAIVRITQRGREAVSANTRIDSRFLRQFPEFIEFVRGGEREGPEGGEGKQAVAPPVSPERTPEELIESGYRQVQNALASDLLDRVKGASPAFFERLLVQLLVAMGYGGSIERGRRSGSPATRGSTASSRRTGSASM